MRGHVAAPPAAGVERPPEHAVGQPEGHGDGIFWFLPEHPMGALTPLFELAVAGINVVGVVVLVWAVLCGARQLIGAEFGFMFGAELRGDREAWRAKTARLRQDVGVYLLLGLELLIAADVIETMINPTLDTVAVLAAIVAIRIATSYFLGKEIQHAHHQAGRPGAEGVTA